MNFALTLLAWLGAATAFAASTNTLSAPEVLRATLANGLRVIIVRNSLAPVVTTVINYQAGSDEAPEGFPGTAHALEHMMFRGSPALSADQLADVTAALGGDFNADTEQSVTQYFFTVPAEDLALALRIEAIRMRGLAKDEKLWTQERGAIEQEVAQDLSSPDYIFQMRLMETMFKGTPYEHDALGTRPSFEKTTDAMLRKFHDTWYAPNNAILVIVGDVPPAPALEKVQQFFGAIRPAALAPRPEFHFQPVTPQSLKLDTDLPYGLDVIAFRFPGADSPDYAAAQILSDVLGSQRGDLYGLVPAGRALSASFSYDTLPKAGVGYAEVAFPPGADAKALRSQIRDILAATLTNGVVEDLVNAAKRREIASDEFQKDSVFGLAMAWSAAVAVEGRQSPEDDIEAVRRVTVADVNRVARQYLDFDHAMTAILTPQASGQAVSTKGFGGKESFAPDKTKAVKLPAWARQAVNRLEIPASSLTPWVTNLPNGIELIVQPESASDTVNVYGKVKNRPKVEMPPGKDGVDDALDQLFSFGTRSLDRLAFQKALDDIGADESAGAEFSLQVLSDQFDRGAQLLADNEISPALPEEAFKVIQPQLAASAAGELESPNHQADRALDNGLFPKGDPALRETTPDSVKSLTIQDVRDYYRLAFRPDLTTIVVIGKVTPEHALEVIGKYFGGWTSIGSKPDILLPPAPPNPAETFQVPDDSRVQDDATLAQTIQLTRTNSDYYALELGNHVLGGAFYATRLYRDLREINGLVYTVSSTFQVDLTRGVYEASYACDPPNVARARAILVHDLKQMQTTDVSARELNQAKVLLLREIPLSESSIERIAKGWLSRVSLDLPLDEPIRAAHRYVALQAGDVRAAFAKWLRPDELVEIIEGPAPK